MEITSSHGEVDRTKALYGTPWVGTNSPEELIEVQNHLSQMIASGYSYLFMERHLTSMSYPVNVIRHAFTKLTGLKVEDAVNYKWIYSPGNIPQINLGWGYAKGDKAVSYFVHPVGPWYMIFKQVDDMRREDVSKHLCLVDAIEELGTLVKKVERWDPPVKEEDSNMDMTQLYRQPQIFMQASEAFRNTRANMERIHSAEERRRIVDQAYASGTITKEMRESLMGVFAKDDAEEEAVKDQLQSLTDESRKKPFKDVIPSTPQEHFDRQKLNTSPVKIADALGTITNYVSEQNEELQQFDISMDSGAFKVISPAGTPTPAGLEEPDIMNATAWIAVLLRIVNKGNKAWRWGMITYEIIGNEVKTEGTIKGDDNRPYGISDEALSDYFSQGESADQGAQSGPKSS